MESCVIHILFLLKALLQSSGPAGVEIETILQRQVKKVSRNKSMHDFFQIFRLKDGFDPLQCHVVGKSRNSDRCNILCRQGNSI